MIWASKMDTSALSGGDPVTAARKKRHQIPRCDSGFSSHWPDATVESKKIL
jgi:hypothetical protein